MRGVIVVSLLACLAAASHDQECEPYKDYPNHTMCKYKEAACPGYTLMKRSLSAEQKTKILKLHNFLRWRLVQNKVSGQPAANSMPPMVWDTELETVAQRLADQCKAQHDESRRVERFRVGQNIFMSANYPIAKDQNPDVATAAFSWWLECQFPGHNPANVASYVHDANTGHYTQMAWANSTQMGCGYSMYCDTTGTKKKSYKLVVCNYGPAGNVLKQPIYDIKK